MRQRHVFRPLLDGVLEDRVVLSHAALSAAAITTQPNSLVGHVTGVSHSFPPTPNLPGSGYDIELKGTAVIAGVAFRATGTLAGNNTVAPPSKRNPRAT